MKLGFRYLGFGGVWVLCERVHGPWENALPGVAVVRVIGDDHTMDREIRESRLVNNAHTHAARAAWVAS